MQGCRTFQGLLLKTSCLEIVDIHSAPSSFVLDTRISAFKELGRCNHLFRSLVYSRNHLNRFHFFFPPCLITMRLILNLVFQLQNFLFYLRGLYLSATFSLLVLGIYLLIQLALHIRFLLEIIFYLLLPLLISLLNEGSL